MTDMLIHLICAKQKKQMNLDKKNKIPKEILNAANATEIPRNVLKADKKSKLSVNLKKIPTYKDGQIHPVEYYCRSESSIHFFLPCL